MQYLIEQEDCRVYQLEPFAQVSRFVATTGDTRAICNDPFIFGTSYTSRLRQAMTQVLAALGRAKIVVGEERNAVVLHILRGGLNFGLREALSSAYGWERHHGAFVSSQRACSGQKGWYITEDSYEKVMMIARTDWIIADVVATGVSLERALLKLIRMSRESEKSIRRITFFTIGGARAEQLVAEADARCRKAFPAHYLGACVVYLEGIFGVADENSPLSIAIPGTDLLRHPAEALAPEFVASQAESPSYALERCTIYDAGSRAFDVDEYLRDVSDYWARVLTLASQGTTYETYLRERFPADPRLDKEIPADWRSAALLSDIATKQIVRAR